MATGTIDLHKVEEELKAIRKDLDFIKEHMVDVDTILSEEDKEALARAEEEFKNKKTISHDQLKKDLGL